MKKFLAGLVTAGLLICLFGCATNNMVHETVLRPGERITATNRFGKVQIAYVSPKERLYEGEGFHEIRKLQPRDERWYGSLGLYDPADTFLSASKIRLVLQEGIRNFRSEEQMLAKLHEGSATMDWVYNSSGLVVGFGRIPARGNQINIDVFQYLVNGNKPLVIPFARPSNIQRESLDPTSTAKYAASRDLKPQDEVPPLINNPFDPKSTNGGVVQ